MATQDTTIWGIHGGRTGDADTLFLSGHCVALGWHEMADLAAIRPGRTYVTAFPDMKTFREYASDIAWEISAWVAEAPIT